MLSLDPPAEERQEALYWLSEVSDNPREQRELLESILAYNLGDARARRKLAILDGKLRPEDLVDPDRPVQPAAEDPRAVQTRAFTCPKCGGRMTFAPDGHSLTCEYCESRQRIPGARGPDEEDFLVALATAKAHHRPMTAQSVVCSGCSAAFILPPETITQTCPYCQTPYAIQQVEVRTLDAPDSILPFSVTAEQAREALLAWLEDARPEGALKVSRPSGIYLPVWLFNIGGQIDWSGWVYQNKRQVPVSGARVISLPNLLVPAANRLPEGLSAVLQGFDLDALQPYDPRYLASFPAETFAETAADASLEARRLAMEHEIRDVRLEVFDQTIEDLHLRTTNMLVEGYRLALVPVWLAYYTIDLRRFDVAINGQSGAVTAQRPERGLLDWVKGLF